MATPAARARCPGTASTTTAARHEGTATKVYYIWYGTGPATPPRPSSPISWATRRLALLQHQHDVLRRIEAHVSELVGTRAPRLTTTRTAPPERCDVQHRANAITRDAAQGHERRLLRAHLGRRERDVRLLHAVLRLAHLRHDRRRRHQVLVRRQPRPLPVRLRGADDARTATRAPTAWPGSSPTSSRRRSPIPI